MPSSTRMPPDFEAKVCAVQRRNDHSKVSDYASRQAQRRGLLSREFLSHRRHASGS